MISLHKYTAPIFAVLEKKGIGHPDTLAYGISESISRSLSKYYLDGFGQILRHNVDTGSDHCWTEFPRFGGSSISNPPSLGCRGRATRPR